MREIWLRGTIAVTTTDAAMPLLPIISGLERMLQAQGASTVDSGADTISFEGYQRLLRWPSHRALNAIDRGSISLAPTAGAITLTYRLCYTRFVWLSMAVVSAATAISVAIPPIPGIGTAARALFIFAYFTVGMVGFTLIASPWRVRRMIVRTAKQVIRSTLDVRPTLRSTTVITSNQRV